MNFLEKVSKIKDICVAKKLTLATAESCTGGMISQNITSISGASIFFTHGYVTYSNQAKMDLLSVTKNSLESYGAVSGEVALEMAKGAKKRSNTDIAISVTGIAGPDGGTEKKPVGTVFIGCAIFNKSSFRELHLTGDRKEIREKSTDEALSFLIDELGDLSEL